MYWFFYLAHKLGDFQLPPFITEAINTGSKNYCTQSLRRSPKIVTTNNHVKKNEIINSLDS